MNTEKQKIFPIDNKKDDKKTESEINSNYDYCPLPLKNDAEKEILMVNIQNTRFDYSKASAFMDFMKEKLGSDYKLVIFDFSECVFMDAVFLGAVIVMLKLTASKNIEASIILDMSKFETLHSVEYSIDKLKRKVKIFSTLQQVENYFGIKNINDQMFVLSKVV